MFLRALSGAGYADSHNVNAPQDVGSVQPGGVNVTNVSDAPTGPAHALSGYRDIDFASYWTSFKDAIFSCPVDLNAGEQEKKMGAACMKAKLGALGERVMAAGGARAVPEDRAFRASLEFVPRRKRTEQPPRQ